MIWKIKLFFYLSVGCSLCGFIFPTHVTQAVGYDIGDMVLWIYDSDPNKKYNFG